MSRPVINVRYKENGEIDAIEISGVEFKKADKYDLKEFAEALLGYLRRWL